MSIIEETLHRLEQVQNPGLSATLPAGTALGRPPQRRNWLLPAAALTLSGAMLAAGGFLFLASPGDPPKDDPLGRGAAAGQPSANLQPVALAGRDEGEKASANRGAAPESPATGQAQMTSEAPAPAAVVVTAVKDGAALPEWLSAGKELWASGKPDQALAAWDKGVAGLPSQQRLIAVAAFYDRPSADKALSRLDEIPGAFLTRGLYRGHDAFYAAVHAEPESRQAVLSRVRELTGIRSAAVTTAGRLNQSLNGEAPVVQAAAIKQSGGRESFVKAAAAPATATGNGSGATSAGHPPAAAGTEDYRFDGRAEPIRAAFRAGQWREVEERSRPLLLEAGGRWEVWWWMGRAVLGQGRAAEADNYLSRAAELNPGVADVWLSRAIASQERGDHGRAVVYLEQARSLAPSSPEVWFNLGYSRQALGNKSLAEEEWGRFLQLAGDSSRYASLRRYVEQRLGR